MGSKKKWLGAGVIIIVLAGIAWYIYNRGQDVSVSKVAQGTIKTTVTETGYVKSLDEYEVQASQSGRVAKIEVVNGQLVSQGQMLMNLSNPDIESAKNNARASLVLAQSELTIARQVLDGYYIDLGDAELQWKRQKALFEAGACSQVDFDTVSSNLDKANQMVKGQQEYTARLENQISVYNEIIRNSEQKEQELIIYSPIDGKVLDLPVKTGAYVNPGALLCQIGTAGHLEIQADLLSDDLRDVKVGQPVAVSAIVLGDKVLKGQVREIRPRAYAKTSALGVEQRRVPVFMSVEDNDILKPGYEVQVSIETAQSEGLLISRESLRNLGGGCFQVLKVVKNRVHYQDVELGISNQDQSEVLKGIAEGEIIVKDGSLQLEENALVKAQ